MMAFRSNFLLGAAIKIRVEFSRQMKPTRTHAVTAWAGWALGGVSLLSDKGWSITCLV